jgi:hypothetical protein
MSTPQESVTCRGTKWEEVVLLVLVHVSSFRRSLAMASLSFGAVEAEPELVELEVTTRDKKVSNMTISDPSVEDRLIRSGGAVK